MRYLTLLIIFFSRVSFAQCDGNRNNAFNAGEHLYFRLHYGWLSAGNAELVIKNNIVNYSGHTCYFIYGSGSSKGPLDLFFKVRDYYETLIDTARLVPVRFVRSVKEGGYSTVDTIIFNQQKRTALSNGKPFPVSNCVQDVLSAFYYVRTLDLSKAANGDVFPITAFLDGESFPMSVKIIGMEILNTKLGKIKCYIFRPLLKEGEILKEKEDMTVWISADENKLPVRIETSLIVGSIKMELTRSEGTRWPVITK